MSDIGSEEFEEEEGFNLGAEETIKKGRLHDREKMARIRQRLERFQ